MRAVVPRIGLRTALTAFAVVMRGMARRGRPGPRAPSATVSAEWAKIVGKRYVSIGPSLSEPKAMVEGCAPTTNQARAVCGMVACVRMRGCALWLRAMWRAMVALPGYVGHMVRTSFRLDLSTQRLEASHKRARPPARHMLFYFCISRISS